MIDKMIVKEEEWRDRLSPERFHILIDEGTERPHTSPLNQEKRAGSFHCAGCGLELFTSQMKYDSGTGWPSFFEVIEDHIETKPDNKLFRQRTEYHCARCGGHQGHVFNDRQAPSGKRYCNNGLALTFELEGAPAHPEGALVKPESAPAKPESDLDSKQSDA